MGDFIAIYFDVVPPIASGHGRLPRRRARRRRSAGDERDHFSRTVNIAALVLAMADAQARCSTEAVWGCPVVAALLAGDRA